MTDNDVYPERRDMLDALMAAMYATEQIPTPTVAQWAVDIADWLSDHDWRMVYDR